MNKRKILKKSNGLKGRQIRRKAKNGGNLGAFVVLATTVVTLIFWVTYLAFPPSIAQYRSESSSVSNLFKKGKKKGAPVQYSTNETAWGIIHLGKCGGVSMRYTLSTAPQLLLGVMSRNAAMYHIKPPSLTDHNRWLVVIRDPIPRVQSWFVYDHPVNFEWRKDRLGWKVKSRKIKELFDCYPTLDSLITEGIQKEYGTNESKCRRLAFASIPPTGPSWLTGLQHMRWNFYNYFYELLLMDDKEIFVVRTEHMLDDLNNINHQLGDPKSFPSVMHVSHWNNSSYPMKSRTISRQGMANLCRQLCTEIQIYKTLLYRAENLRSQDIEESIEQLRKECPVQLESQDCPSRIQNPEAYFRDMTKLYIDEASQLMKDKKELDGKLAKQRAESMRADKKTKLSQLISNKQKAVEVQFGFIQLGLSGANAVRATFERFPRKRLSEKFKSSSQVFENTEPQVGTIDYWVVFVRNPVNRIKDWWLYDHPLNDKFRSDNGNEDDNAGGGYPEVAFERRKKLFSCFPSLDDLVTRGLRLETRDQIYWDECQKVARQALPRRGFGTVGTLNNLNWNYDRYYSNLLELKESKRIFVIRQGQLLLDLNVIEKLLGGSDRFPSLVRQSVWKNRGNEPLGMSDQNIGKEGMRNLCRHLCNEIQIYKSLLREGLNLSEKDYEREMSVLRKDCAMETDFPKNKKCF